jgi:hypothetical protein
MNSYDEPVLFAKIVITSLSEHPNVAASAKAHFRETLLNSEALHLYELATNSVVASKEGLTLKCICTCEPMEVKWSSFNEPISETALVQNLTRQSLLNAFD